MALLTSQAITRSIRRCLVHGEFSEANLTTLVLSVTQAELSSLPWLHSPYADILNSINILSNEREVLSFQSEVRLGEPYLFIGTST